MPRARPTASRHGMARHAALPPRVARSRSGATGAPSPAGDAAARPSWGRRLFRGTLGLLALPLCWAVSATLFHLLQPATPAAAGAPRFPLEMAALGGGFALWVAVYFLLPLSARPYIWAHELTHALWALLQGIKVGKIKVGDHGGYVTLSRTNALVGLAPYFFPFYALIAILVWWILGFFVDPAPWRPLWLFVVGAAWGHHVTYTLASLAVHQPDIIENGHLFSYAAIFLLNLLGICAWVVCTTPATFREFGSTLSGQAIDAYLWTADHIAAAVGWAVAKIK